MNDTETDYVVDLESENDRQQNGIKLLKDAICDLIQLRDSNRFLGRPGELTPAIRTLLDVLTAWENERALFLAEQ